MHKRRVIRFFSILLLFALALLVVQKAYFGSITGNIVGDPNVDSGAPFKVRIQSLDMHSEVLTANLLFASNQTNTLILYGYAQQGGKTIASNQADIAAGQETQYSFRIQVPYDSKPDTFVLYATDGSSGVKLIEPVYKTKLAGFVTIEQGSSTAGLWSALLLAGIILLLVIIFGILISRHRKQAQLLAIEQSRPRYIKIDVK